MLLRSFKGVGLSRRGGCLPAVHFKRAAGVGLVLGLAVASASATAAGDASIVTYANPGIGIGVDSGLPGGSIEINHDPRTGYSEALAIDLGAEFSSLTFQTVAMQVDEVGGYREWGRWQAFDQSGLLVGQGTFSGPNPAPTIETDGMRYVVFTALPYTLTSDDPGVPPILGIPDPGKPPSGYPGNDSSDYYIASITLGSVTYTGSDSATWAGLSPSGFAAGTNYLEGGRFVDAPLVVNTLECAGSAQENNTVGCELQLTQEFKTIIKNSPDVNGTIELNNVETIEDPRPACGGSGQVDGPLDLSSYLGLAPGTGPFLPAYLCGQVDPADQKSKFTIVDVNNINLTTERSVLEHEVTLDAGSEYQCATGDQVKRGLAPTSPSATVDQRRSKLPVISWLPKNSVNEIPVADAQGGKVAQMQDITYACGSARGGTSRYSYFVYNLHYVDGTDYRPIVRAELEQLKATIDQTSSCVDRRRAYNGMAFGISVAIWAYDNRLDNLAKFQLQALLAYFESSLMDREFEKCFYDLSGGSVVPGYPGQYDNVSTTIPRNFRGDLIAQTRHTLYMFGRMLGVLTPRLPEDFKGL